MMVAQYEDASPLEIDERDDGVAVRIVVAGEIDMGNAFRVTRAAVAAGMRAPDRPVELDLSGVEYIDSTGVRALVDADRALPGALRVVRPSPVVVRVLDLTRLVEVLTVDDGRDDSGAR